MIHDTEEGQTALIPAASPAPVSAVPSRRPKGIDRAAAARLLAEGRSIAEAARAVGCTRQNLWRQVQRSKRLARLIRSAEEEARTDAYGKLARLGPAAVDTLRRALVEGDNPGVAFKIVERMKLFERPAAADPIRGQLSTAGTAFAELLAAVTQRAMAASRNGRIRFTPRDYMTLWDQALDERSAWDEQLGRVAPRPTIAAEEWDADDIDEEGSTIVADQGVAD